MANPVSLEDTELYRYISARNLTDTFDSETIHLTDRGGRGALYLSVIYGTLDRCLSVDVPWDLDMVTSFGNTALHVSALNNYSHCVLMLIKAGASPNIRNNDGKRPLDMTWSRRLCGNNLEAHNRRDAIRSAFYERESFVKSAGKID